MDNTSSSSENSSVPMNFYISSEQKCTREMHKLLAKIYFSNLVPFLV